MDDKFLNPSVASEARGGPSLDRKRIPMSVPRQKLQVPPIEGYHLYWALESRLPQFLQAGYDFVDQKEVVVNNLNVSGNSALSGNASLDSRIRVVAGQTEGGQVEYHVLMKLRDEYWNEDRRLLEERNAQVLSSIFKNEQIMGSDSISPEDKRQRYVKNDLTSFVPPERVPSGHKPLFQRPTRKVR